MRVLGERSRYDHHLRSQAQSGGGYVGAALLEPQGSSKGRPGSPPVAAFFVSGVGVARVREGDCKSLGSVLTRSTRDDPTVEFIQ